MKKHLRTIIIAAAAAAALLLAVFFIQQQGQLLPGFIVWNSRTELSDITGDGSPEKLEVGSKRFTVTAGDNTLFSTDEEWKISDFIVRDIDEDSRPEILLLVWKKGNYGTSRPFWVDKEEGEGTWSEHIFVYKFEDDRIRPLWMSSDIGLNVKSWSIDEADRLHLISDDGSETVWIWGGFGFVLVEDNESGSSFVSQTDDSQITFIAAGDNIAHQGIYSGAREGNSFDFSPIYENIKDIISSADIASVNQETVLVSEPYLISGYPEFGTPLSMGEALADAGFDIVTCATNHIMDKGGESAAGMLSFFKNSFPDITVLGIHDTSEDTAHYSIIEKNNIKLSLFSYTFGLNGHYPSKDSGVTADLLEDKNRLIEDLKDAENLCDISVCFIHFGTEYSSVPDEEQVSLCEELIDSGADIIIGTHPHVIQPVKEITTEEGNNGLVFFSLGNFAANQPVYETILGGLASITITKTTESGHSDTFVSSYEMIPVVCHYSKGYTRVFPLDEYTDKLASDHYIYREIREFTVEDLKKLFETSVK